MNLYLNTILSNKWGEDKTLVWCKDEMLFAMPGWSHGALGISPSVKAKRGG